MNISHTSTISDHLTLKTKFSPKYVQGASRFDPLCLLPGSIISIMVDCKIFNMLASSWLASFFFFFFLDPFFFYQRILPYCIDGCVTGVIVHVLLGIHKCMCKLLFVICQIATFFRTTYVLLFYKRTKLIVTQDQVI